jgi:uncharacterized protein
MSYTLAMTAFLMGLTGGPHCAAMCGAACAGITRHSALAPRRPMWSFQLGRLLGYSAAGAVSAAAVQSFAWLSSGSAVLRPLWFLLHLAVLAWGLTLLVLARQPAWVARSGRSLWVHLRPGNRAGAGVFAAGMMWTFMPCGLLYSALVVASLTGSAWQGALAMALFAAGSGVSLGLFPGLLHALRSRGAGVGQDWVTRLAGLLLAATALWALSADLIRRIAPWCAAWL